MTVRYEVIRRMDLMALAITMPEWDGSHPNRMPFSGVLTRVDEPSTRPPHGAQGHRVLITGAVAEKVGPSVIGMAVDVSDDLSDHTLKKIGVITGYAIDGHDFRVNGFLYGKDFPGVVDKLRQEKDQLGMSFEITEVAVEDEAAPVWALADFVFTGAAILRKTKAAYQLTSLVARRSGEDEMTREKLVALRDNLNATLASMDAEGEAPKDDDEEAKAAAEKAAADKAAADEAAKWPPKDDKKDAEDDQQAQHDDEAEDLAMLKKLHTERAARRAAAAASRTTVAATAETVDFTMAAILRRLSQIESTQRQMSAAQDLITDVITTQGELLTDLVENKKTLATDGAGRGPQGGKISAAAGNGTPPAERPARKTMAAGESLQFLQKFGLQADRQYTTPQVDEALRTAGVTDPTQRIAVKHFLEGTGQLQPAALP